MEYLDVIKKRRSIRIFKDTKISDEIIDSLIESAVFAPSGHNNQPWYYKILNENQIKDIGEILLKFKSDIDISIEHTANIIKNSPKIILIYSDSNTDISNILSLGAFIEHICLTATDFDLGSLWITNLLRAEENVNKYLGVDKKLISAISIGYKDQDPNPRPRKTLNEIKL
ncbi:MAG: nitroreductase family protein [Bacilli bacterium]